MHESHDRLLAAALQGDRFGWTPLMVAAQVGATENVRMLLCAGADRGLSAPDGRTALTLASEAGHLDVAGLF